MDSLIFLPLPMALMLSKGMFFVPVFLLPLRMGIDLQWLPSLKAAANAVGLALFPSLCAFLFTALAIHRIGPTRTAVMGALEPVTAVTIGVFFFHENMTWRLLCGIIIILGAVTIVIKGSAASGSAAGDKKIPELAGQFKVSLDEVMLKPELIEHRDH